MEKCFSCGKQYDPRTLTDYARAKYVSRCGPCVFRAIDAKATRGLRKDLASGAGIIDYVSCDSPSTDGRSYEGNHNHGGRH